MKTESIRPKRFFLSPDNPMRDDVAINAIKYIHEFPTDKHCRIVISEAKCKRTEAQNNLLWAWNAELVTAHDGSHNADYYHAINKLHILLPLMRHDSAFERLRDEAEFLWEAIRAAPTFGHKLRIAYDCVRSKDLRVAECQKYLDAVQRHWITSGYVLTTEHPDYSQAMGVAA